jgi:hypothetical protein
MSDIAKDIFLPILGIMLYSSGLLLWPIRCWLHRKRKIHGGTLRTVFFVQTIVCLGMVFFTVFCARFSENADDWAMLWIVINLLFTVAGLSAWRRDARDEREWTRVTSPETT